MTRFGAGRSANSERSSPQPTTRRLLTLTAAVVSASPPTGWVRSRPLVCHFGCLTTHGNMKTRDGLLGIGQLPVVFHKKISTAGAHDVEVFFCVFFFGPGFFLCEV